MLNCMLDYFWLLGCCCFVWAACACGCLVVRTEGRRANLKPKKGTGFTIVFPFWGGSRHCVCSCDLCSIYVVSASLSILTNSEQTSKPFPIPHFRKVWKALAHAFEVRAGRWHRPQVWRWPGQAWDEMRWSILPITLTYFGRVTQSSYFARSCEAVIFSHFWKPCILVMSFHPGLTHCKSASIESSYQRLQLRCWTGSRSR